MAGVSIEVDSAGLRRLQDRLARIADAGARRSLLESVSAEIESQTHRRLRAGGPAPDGAPWQEWSDAYELTRHSNHGLLYSEGDLDDSIQALVSGDEAEVGTNLVYGAIHQFGGAEVGRPGLPARPYLGLSNEDETDLAAIIDEWGRRQIRDD